MFLYNLKNGNFISKNYVIVIKYGRKSRLNYVIFIYLSRSGEKCKSICYFAIG